MVVFKKKEGGGGTTEWDIFKFLNLHFFVGDRNKKSSEIAEFQRISRVKSSFEWCHQESNNTIQSPNLQYFNIFGKIPEPLNQPYAKFTNFR